MLFPEGGEGLGSQGAEEWEHDGHGGHLGEEREHSSLGCC